MKEKEILKNCKRGEAVEYILEENGVSTSLVIWRDNRCVYLLSTICGINPSTAVKRFDRSKGEYGNVSCPAIVKVYNKHMGGVDLMDSHLGRHHIRIKTRKNWYRRLFYHLLDMAIINSWIIHRRVSRKRKTSTSDIRNDSAKEMTQKQFLIYVGESLLKSGSRAPKRGRPSGGDQCPISKKRMKQGTIPIKEVRLDGVGHRPVHERRESKMRCKNAKCTGHTYWKCAK
ncbi:unnamed protein product, partial [Nesidiocoris tenuis]